MSVSQYLPLLQSQAAILGAPQAMIDYLSRVMGQESGGNPHAKSNTSSASGLFGFIKGTFANYTGLSGLAKDYSPEVQIEAAVKFAQDNAQTLKNVLGRDPTAGELYLAHFAGPGGATKILQAPDSTMVGDILGDAVVRANASIKFRGKSFAQFTAQDLEDWAASVMGAKQYIEAKDRGEIFSEEEERKKRHDILQDFGMNEKQITALGDILGALVMSIIRLFFRDALPANERTETPVVEGTLATGADVVSQHLYQPTAPAVANQRI